MLLLNSVFRKSTVNFCHFFFSKRIVNHHLWESMAQQLSIASFSFAALLLGYFSFASASRMRRFDSNISKALYMNAGGFALALKLATTPASVKYPMR